MTHALKHRQDNALQAPHSRGARLTIASEIAQTGVVQAHLRHAALAQARHTSASLRPSRVSCRRCIVPSDNLPQCDTNRITALVGHMRRPSGGSLARIRRRGVWRPLLGLLAGAFVLVGLLGAGSYWEAYYQHRGFATAARLPRAGAGRLLSVSVYSRSLRRSADYLAYLPPGYDSSRHYPVFYLLHGTPGRPQVFVDIANTDIRLDNRLSQRQVPPMILVFPDGRINGSTFSDSEWANTPSGRFEDYVLDVVQDVDRRFAAIRDRQARVVGGFSAGGYGAINIALHHLDVFGSVQVWSGYFTQTPTGVFTNATSAELAYNSPIEYVKQLRRELAVLPLRVFMFVGRADTAGRQIVAMAHALESNGAQVSYAIYPGGHDWQLWYGHLNQMLILAGRDVLEPLARARRPAHRPISRGPVHRPARSVRHQPRARSARQDRRAAAGLVPISSAAAPRGLTIAESAGGAPGGWLVGGLLSALVSRPPSSCALAGLVIVENRQRSRCAR